MINRVYQLIRPSFFSIKYEDVSFYEEDTVVVRPNYLALCHADQRYFQGTRPAKILQKKLPMAVCSLGFGGIKNSAFFTISELRFTCVPGCP